jgi:hypothetical protein
MSTDNKKQSENLKALMSDTSTILEKSPIYSLIENLKKIDLDSPEAKLNETSISDGNGGRIELVRNVNKKK